MKRVFIGVGIDKYQDKNIHELPGASEDAGTVGFLFQCDLGYEKHVLLNTDSTRMYDLFSEVVRDLGNGDTLVLYFVGHGHSIPGVGSAEPEQSLLLYNANYKRLQANQNQPGAISLNQLVSESAKPYLNRAFIIDACRAPLRNSGTVDMAPQTTTWFDSTSDAIHRELIHRYSRVLLTGEASPLVILNSCSDGQTAKLLKEAKRSLYSLAFQNTLKEEFRFNKPIVLDDHFDAAIKRQMDSIAKDNQINHEGQKPVRQGADLCLFGIEDRAAPAAWQGVHEHNQHPPITEPGPKPKGGKDLREGVSVVPKVGLWLVVFSLSATILVMGALIAFRSADGNGSERRVQMPAFEPNQTTTSTNTSSVLPDQDAVEKRAIEMISVRGRRILDAAYPLAKGMLKQNSVELAGTSQARNEWEVNTRLNYTNLLGRPHYLMIQLNFSASAETPRIEITGYSDFIVPRHISAKDIF